MRTSTIFVAGNFSSEASKKALQLDPELSEAHASRGLAHLVCEEFDAAEADQAVEYLGRAVDRGA